MKISDLIAVHEAGHVVVADSLGFTVQHVIVNDQGPAVGAECPIVPTTHEHFMMATFALAGGVAQHRMGWPPDAGCIGDLNAAAKHMADYLGVSVEGRARVEAELIRPQELAKAILVHRWELVKTISTLIRDRDADVPGEVLRPILEASR